jgi:hypothetical protein
MNYTPEPIRSQSAPPYGKDAEEGSILQAQMIGLVRRFQSGGVFSMPFPFFRRFQEPHATRRGGGRSSVVPSTAPRQRATYDPGAGRLLFQMSRCSFHCPPSWRQTTRYLPLSTTWSPAT